MSHLEASEKWPEHDRPRHVAYFCGVLQDSLIRFPKSHPRYPEELRKSAGEFGLRLLKSRVPGEPGPLSVLWKAAFTNGGRDFDWDLLCGSLASGPARLDDQFFRVNIDASERYVLALPDSSRHRLPAHRSGYSNLVLTGDWIWNGLFLGCIEGAVIAGKQAARAVSGAAIEIVGEGDLFERPA